MSNLLTAILATNLFTNWVTVSRTTPVTHSPYNAVYLVSTLNQLGYRGTNVVALFEWKGARKECVLETSQEAFPSLQRTVEDGQNSLITLP